MTPQRFQKLVRTLDKRQPDLTLLTEQIHKPRNIAALVRTSDAVGIHELNMVWPWGKHTPYSGTAMGRDRWVDIVRHQTMASGIETLKSRGYKIYAAHLSSDSVDYRNVDFTQPYSENVRQALAAAFKVQQLDVVNGGVQAVTQGPRLETAAEIDRLERDGCHVVGMTGMPEAALARELDLNYACVCLVVNPAAGRSDSLITMEDIHTVVEEGMVGIRSVLKSVVGFL